MAVLVARFLMKRLPKKYSFVLWGIVAVRMLFDLQIPSVLSLFNLFPVSDGESQPLLKDYQMSRIDAIAGRIVAGNVHTLNTQIQGFSDVSAASTVPPAHVILSVMCIIWLIGITVVIIYGVISYIQCKKITAQAVRMKENVWECDNLPSPKNLAFAPLAFGESDASKRIKNVLRFKMPRLYTVIIAVVVIVVISVICLTNKKDSHEDIERITDVEQNLEGNNTEETRTFE